MKMNKNTQRLIDAAFEAATSEPLENAGNQLAELCAANAALQGACRPRIPLGGERELGGPGGDALDGGDAGWSLRRRGGNEEQWRSG